jgi:DNA-binding transcriptional LysR family regulator
MHQIRYFLAIVREGSFNRAAVACEVSQPSITRAIRKLEEELGGPLFDRHRSRVELSELGRRVLPRLERIHGEVDQTLKDAAHLSTMHGRQLRLGLMCTLGPRRLIDLVEATSRRVKNVELSIGEGKARQILDDLIADKYDVAIVALPKLPDEVTSIPLHTERYSVAFRPGHRFEQFDEVPFDELIAERYLDRLNCEFDDYYAAHFGDQPFDLDIRYSSEREDWIQAMLIAGFGVAIVPEFLPVMPGILLRPITQPTMERHVSIITVRGRPHAPAVAAFVRAATAALKSGKD